MIFDSLYFFSRFITSFSLDMRVVQTQLYYSTEKANKYFDFFIYDNFKAIGNWPLAIVIYEQWVA